MKDFDWRERTSINPNVCHGKPCIKGTRIIVSIILNYLTAGETVKTILNEYPTFTKEDIRAAIGYAGHNRGRATISPRRRPPGLRALRKSGVLTPRLLPCSLSS